MEIQASEVAATRKDVHYAIRSLNELKETQARRDRVVGLRRLTGSRGELVCAGASEIVSILNRSRAIAQNLVASVETAGSSLKRIREKEWHFIDICHIMSQGRGLKSTNLHYFEPDDIRIPFFKAIAIPLHGSFLALKFTCIPTGISHKSNSEQKKVRCALSKKTLQTDFASKNCESIGFLKDVHCGHRDGFLNFALTILHSDIRSSFRFVLDALVRESAFGAFRDIELSSRAVIPQSSSLIEIQLVPFLIGQMARFQSRRRLLLYLLNKHMHDYTIHEGYSQIQNKTHNAVFGQSVNGNPGSPLVGYRSLPIHYRQIMTLDLTKRRFHPLKTQKILLNQSKLIIGQILWMAEQSHFLPRTMLQALDDSWHHLDPQLTGPDHIFRHPASTGITSSGRTGTLVIECGSHEFKNKAFENIVHRDCNVEHRFAEGVYFTKRNLKVIQSGEKGLDLGVDLKVLKLLNFPNDFLMKVLPIVCNHPS